MSLLITGATGFIGKELVKSLEGYPENIFIIVREHSLKTAIRVFSKNNNIKFVIGDLTQINVLEDYRDIDLLGDVEKLIHLGGGYNIEMDRESAYLQNIVGSQNIIALSKKLKKLKEFHFASSFSVIGTSLEKADANSFAHDSERLSPYAESKMHAEKIVRKSFEGILDVSLVIYRPGIVIPNMGEGLEKIDGPYYFLKGLVQKKRFLNYLPRQIFSFFPYDKDAYLPLVTVGSVAHFMANKIKEKQVRPVQSFYLINKKNKSVRQFMEETFFHFGISLNIQPLPRFVAKKINYGFGLFPRELAGFAFFKTALKNDTGISSQYGEINVEAMIEQTKSYQGRVSND